jgi:hypothetical protein
VEGTTGRRRTDFRQTQDIGYFGLNAGSDGLEVVAGVAREGGDWGKILHFAWAFEKNL